jgi:hypothetical protein
MLNHFVNDPSWLALFNDAIYTPTAKCLRHILPQPLLFAPAHFFWPIGVHYGQLTVGKGADDSIGMNQRQLGREMLRHFPDVRENRLAVVRVIDWKKNPLKWQHTFTSLFELPWTSYVLFKAPLGPNPLTPRQRFQAYAGLL